MPLRYELSKFSKHGKQAYATVEALTNGLATVRLAGSTRRLSNLITTNRDIQVGDTVLLDYTSGTPPIVKRILSHEDDVSLITADVAPIMASTDEVDLSPIGFSLTRTSDLLVTPGSWTPITFDTVLWDDAEFLVGNQIIMPTSGLYFVTLNIAVSGFTQVEWVNVNTYRDARDYYFYYVDQEFFHVRVRGSSFGHIASKTAFGMDYDVNVPATTSLSGIFFASSNETLLVDVNVTSAKSYVKFPANVGLYPVLCAQRIDTTGDEYNDVLGILGAI